MNILISACLLGLQCRYDGQEKEYEQIEQLKKKHHLLPVCPEIYGGLATPRCPSERVVGRVLTKDGVDVTRQYEKGAREALRLAQMFDCQYAVLKEKSPSCGHGLIYDGSFSRNLTEGNGVTAELLLTNGIQVFGENELEQLIVALKDCR